MNFTNKLVENYSIDKSTRPSSVCDEIKADTLATHPQSHMMIGELEGSFLGFLIRAMSVKRVLEIGTFTGYSAQAMAEQLPEDGEIITIDKSKKYQKLARTYWDKSEHGKKIKTLAGIGTEVIMEVEGDFDLIFIDADKSGYKTYFERSLELLSPKGVIAIDNVLWSGRVVEEIEKECEPDKSTKYLKELNDLIASREDLYSTLLPIRDGIFLIQKK